MNKSKSVPIRQKLLIPMMLLVIIENILLISAIFGSRLLSYVENKEKAIFYEKVSNRKNYLENEMLTRWANVNNTVQEINNTTQKLIDTKKISLDTLDDGSEYCTPLLRKVSSKLIRLMRANQVTGAFIVLNTDNLEEKKEEGIFENKPGIYLRDFDPTSTPSKKNQDLLFKYAPKALTQSMNISHGKTWKPLFEFEKEKAYGSYLYEPYQAALKEEDPTEIELKDFGYWSPPYTLYDDDTQVIAYSVPLILNDGTIYGVLGIDISLDYLQQQLPNEELIENDQGSYLVGIEGENLGTFRNVLINGMIYSQAAGNLQTTQIAEKNDGYIIKNQDKIMYADAGYLDLYGENTEFSSQKWALIGIVPKNKLLVFSDRIIKTLIGAVLITMLIGIVGAIIISLTISKPVDRLIQSVKSIKPSGDIQFIRTGIQEVDLLSQSIENMNEEIVDTAKRFSRIINMASIDLAGFEINRKENTVYFTGKFAELFGLSKESFFDVTSIDMFEELMKKLKEYELDRENQNQKENEIIYLIPDENPRYVRLTINDTGDYCSGLVENITDMMMEKEQIEYERDHDQLTGLLNRRAFYRIMKNLFWQGKSILKIAALVMIDLDGLKYVNDTYGHEFGDKYIQSAADTFMDSVPDGTVVSRPGGDEFYILFYGYKSKVEIEEKLYQLQNDIKHQQIILPGGEAFPLHLSAGVVWYPQDTTDSKLFMQYADFAMYQIKHTVKDQFGYFDMEAYRTSQEQYNEEKD
nr:diguanylate cyclase [uncultured Anaerobutyricum sp.]